MSLGCSCMIILSFTITYRSGMVYSRAYLSLIGWGSYSPFSSSRWYSSWLNSSNMTYRFCEKVFNGSATTALLECVMQFCKTYMKWIFLRIVRAILSHFFFSVVKAVMCSAVNDVFDVRYGGCVEVGSVVWYVMTVSVHVMLPSTNIRFLTSAVSVTKNVLVCYWPVRLCCCH